MGFMMTDNIFLKIIHKQIPGSKFAVMPGVAHMMSAEVPEAFHAIVRPFIDLHAGR